MLNLSTEPKFCMCKAHPWKLMCFIHIFSFHVFLFLVKFFSLHCQASMTVVVSACM